MAQGTPGGGGVTDTGLASILASALSGSGSSSGGSTNPLEDLLQGTMLGMSGRQGLTGQSLIGILPQWVRANPTLLSAVRGGQVDPYLPTNDPSTWRVFVGGSERRKNIPNQLAGTMDNAGVPRALGGDKTEMVNSVANQPFLWSEDEVAGAIKKFQDAGITNVTDFDSMQKAWSGLVQRAGAMYSLSSGQRKVTPWDVLGLYKNEMQKAGTLGAGASTSPTTVTQRSRSVSTITNGDGWSVLQNTLSHMLGRDPTESETRDFVGRMNHLAAKNPTITTSTTSGIGSAHQNTTSHTKSGFDQNDILQNAYQDAQANHDYAETQAGTTYYNAALSALGAIGG